jgi:uncharacterized protein VirK/YbjX
MHPNTRAERRAQRERIISKRMIEVGAVCYKWSAGPSNDWEYKWDIRPGMLHKKHLIQKSHSRWDDYAINRKKLRKLLNQFPGYPYKIRRKYVRKSMRDKY